jgi:hypothetical protein
MAKSKVEIQKGQLEAHVPTMKSMSRPEIDREDAKDHALKRSAMNLILHTPKK